MNNFIVSALKYRPSTFRSVVGQHALTTTLKNAIDSNHLSHAYLFCGPRGVGKTTCARIFAKTINCQNLTEDKEACNQCESCVSFNEQRSYNIHELDAASNNSVDDIRSLIDQVRIPPQIGKYSVYIIDEVHMLTPGAFNAFLKTLEEPPAHAMFILATTEKHKIIPTILSRCQIYDFNRITISDTVKHLQYVAEKEGVEVDVNGLNIIAQKSDGGMRDALSIFDQLVSFCGNKITYQGAIDNLNVLDYEYYFKLTEAFLKSDISNALLIFNEILYKGFDAHHFITGLSSHFRDLLVSKDPQTISLLEVGADIGQRYHHQSIQCPSDFLMKALKINNDCDLNYRISSNKRLLVELNLIRLTQLSDEKKKDELTDQLNPPLKKIGGSENSGIISTPANSKSTNSVNSISNPVQTIKAEATPAKSNPTTTNSDSHKTGFKRPISISISKPQEKVQATTVSQNKQINQLVQNQTQTSGNYSEEDLYKYWKEYISEIPEIPTAISFILNNQPEKVEDKHYRIKTSNVFQSNEMKRLLPGILRYLGEKIGNNTLRFSVELMEENNLPRSNNPEETLKIMMEENSALKTLKNDLNLEID